MRITPALLAIALAACVGQITPPKAPAAPAPHPIPPPPPPPPPAPSACNGTPSVAPTVARRMTRWEYDNTLLDLLADGTHPAADFDAEEEVLGFNNNSAALVTSSAMVEKLMNASEGIAARATSNLSALAWLSCGQQLDDTCAAAFVDAFASRAYRRALEPDEHTALVDLYQTGKTIGGLGLDGGELTGFDAGLQLVIEAVLQSPDFLYRLESATASGGAERVTGYELASRLSYLLWGSMPDDALLAAAGKGELDTPAQVLAQAQRMIQDPRSRALVVQFHQQWLDFDRIGKVGKAASIYPEWSSEIGSLMLQETQQFVEHVVFDGEGSWDALVSAQYSYLNPRLASFYGVSANNDPGFTRTTLDMQHAGLLTQGTMMTINAHSDQTSPVHRGKLVREQYFCQPLPPPPAGVVIQVPAPDPNSTARQRFAEHSSNPSCSGCHLLMDPVGFGFENYDGIGRYRTTDNSQPIDATGQLNATDVPGDFDGAAGLAQKLLGSTAAKHCYVKQWFRYGYGRGEQPADACSIEQLETHFENDGHGVKALMLSLTGSDAFLYKAGAP